MATYDVRHSTRYEYELPVLHAHHLAHLRPRALENQMVHSSRIDTSPEAVGTHRKRDYFGNDADVIELLVAHDCLEVTCRSVVTVSQPPLYGVEPRDVPPWDEVVSLMRTDPRYLREREFVFDSPLVRSHLMLQQLGAGIFSPGRSLVDAVRELNQFIFEEFTYEPAATDISTPLGQVVRERRGVCQDFAHVAIGCLRSLGLAARYVSGYLETTPPAGKTRLIGADASHAWPSVFLPQLGWLDFDPTNGVSPKDRHITVAWGRDFSDVSPIKGVVVGGGRHTLSVGVDVELRDVA